MSTKVELEKENKELKQLVRQLRKEVITYVPKEEDLPESSFCILPKGKEFWHFELKLNSETNEIMIADKRKIRGNDFAIASYESRKHLLALLMGKDRNIL